MSTSSTSCHKRVSVVNPRVDSASLDFNRRAHRVIYNWTRQQEEKWKDEKFLNDSSGVSLLSVRRINRRVNRLIEVLRLWFDNARTFQFARSSAVASLPGLDIFLRGRETRRREEKVGILVSAFVGIRAMRPK